MYSFFRTLITSSAKQRTLHILQNQKVHYLFTKALHFPLSRTSLIQPMLALPSNFFKTNFNIIFPPMSRSSTWSLLIYTYVFRVASFLQISPSNPCMNFSSLPYVPCVPSISSYLIWSPQKHSVISTNHKVPDFLQPPVTSSLLDPKVFLSTLSQCSSLNVRDQVQHPYDTRGKITFCTFQSLYSYTANE